MCTMFLCGYFLCNVLEVHKFYVPALLFYLTYLFKKMFSKCV